MAEVAEEFDYWKGQLESSTQELNVLIASDPVSLESIEDVLAGLETKLKKVQTIQPQFSAKWLNYP